MKSNAKFFALTATVATGLALSACGYSTGDRAISGGALGAGVGALGAAATGGSVGGGALLGAGVGAAAGGLTKSKDVNLGKPVWR